MTNFGQLTQVGIAGLIALSALQNSAMAASTKQAIEPFKINAGSTYSDGAMPFSTQYWHLDVVTSPQYKSPTEAGGFAFLPKTATSSGGKMQIVFRDLAVPLQLKCQVGSSMDFKVTISSSGGGAKEFTKGSAPLPGRIEPYLVFDMDDIKQASTTTVGIESNKIAQEGQTWNLIECTVAQRP